MLMGCVAMACGPGGGPTPSVECMPVGEARTFAVGPVTSDCVADPGEIVMLVRPVGECQGDGRCAVVSVSAAEPTGGRVTHECAVQGDPLACSGAVRLTCDPFAGPGAEQPAEVFRGTLTATVELYEGDPGEAAGTIAIDGGGCVATFDVAAEVFPIGE